MAKIGFIGMGNMGHAILKGALKEYPVEEMIFCAKTSETKTKVHAQYVVEFLRIMKKVIFSEKGKTASKITAVKPSESKDKRLIQKIQHELNLIGISPKVVGYRYLTDAILATINEPKTRIFKVLGEKYKKTDASIERAMQNAINRAWRTSDIDDLLTYYTARIHSQKGVPTIMEFIFYYANKIQSQL